MGAENTYNLAQAGNLTPEDYAQQQQLNRQQQMAQMLMQQSQQPQGQMISGRYVAPSWAQSLVPLANIAASKYIGEKADTEASKLAQKIREGKAGYEEQIIKQLSPQPATTEELAGPAYKGVAPSIQYPEKGPDYAAALKTIRTNPYGVGKEMMPEILKKQLGPEDTTDYRNYLKVKSEYDAKGIPITFGQYQDMDANRRRPVTNNIFGGQQGFENTLKLGDKFTAEPIYKAFQEVKQAYKQVNESLNLNSAVGDVAAATKIAKMLDPTSVVRETELATIANATGLTDRLSQLTEKVLTGKMLGPDQRKEFRELSSKFYDVAGNQYNEARSKYSQIGQKNKLEDVETALGAPYKSTAGGWGKATVEGKK